MSIIVIVAGVRVVIAGVGAGVVGGMRGRMAGGGQAGEERIGGRGAVIGVMRGRIRSRRGSKIGLSRLGVFLGDVEGIEAVKVFQAEDEEVAAGEVEV